MPTQESTSDNTTSEALEVTLEAGAVAQIHFSRALNDGEDISVARSTDGGSTYAQPVRDTEKGSSVAAYNRNTGILFGPGWFEVTKPATDSNLQMFIDT